MKKVLAIALGFGLSIGVFATDNNGKKENNTTTSATMIEVSGVIVDENSGEPISGAEIKVEGVAISVYTDLNGKFTFSTLDNNSKINVSFISFKDCKIDLNTLKSNNTITLLEE